MTTKKKPDMIRASRKIDRKKLIIPEDRLRSLIEKVVEEDPANADLMMIVFCKMITGINSGPDGVERLQGALKLCLDSIAPHLGTGRLSASHLLQHLDDLLNQAGLPDVSMLDAIRLMEEDDE